MSRRLLAVILLAVANVCVFAATEAASSTERKAAGQSEPLFSSQWALRAVGVPDRLDAAGPGTVVAVLDTGVSPVHPELVGRVLPGTDLVDHDGDADDENGHGTAVAAMIAANGANGVGIAGACWRCRILPVRVLTSSGAAPWERVAEGIVWAVDHGARVINISIAGTGDSAQLRAAVAHAVANDVLIVASAGNTGHEQPQYPAALEGVVAVAATDPGGRLYDWSARGPWVDLAVPGCSPLPMVFGTYAWACGTSFAAPLAAGIAALVRASDPAAPAVEVASRLPSLVWQAGTATGSVTVAGRPQQGTVLRAAATGFAGARDLGEQVRWFRCVGGESPHACVAVSTGSLYRVAAADAGSRLVARLVTEPFGGLWLAASRPLRVP